jgi:integrase
MTLHLPCLQGISPETRFQCDPPPHSERLLRGPLPHPRRWPKERIVLRSQGAIHVQGPPPPRSAPLEEAEDRLKHLDAFFAGKRIATIGSVDITAYVAKRQREGASNSTINRDLAVLNRMMRLGYEHNKLLRPPVIHKLKEGAARQGFFERNQFEAVRQYLSLDMQVAVTIAYTFGWCMQSEVLTLERRQLDLEAGTLRLEPGGTKNDDGRVVYLTADLKSSLGGQLERVRVLEREMGCILVPLFPHLKGRHRGKRIQDFKKAWKTSCEKAGCPGMLRHDSRRTAVRNMVNVGVPERVAMKVTGHKTRSVFDRYHIVSPADLQEVARKLTGTITGTVGQTVLDANSVSM